MYTGAIQAMIRRGMMELRMEAVDHVIAGLRDGGCCSQASRRKHDSFIERQPQHMEAAGQVASENGATALSIRDCVMGALPAAGKDRTGQFRFVL